jgi:hypothetical protein
MAYRVYRYPHGDLKERLREALRDYYGRHGRLPGSVVVHKSLVRGGGGGAGGAGIAPAPREGGGGLPGAGGVAADE